MDKKIIEHFKKHDSILHSYILKVGILEQIKKEDKKNYFHHLCRDIICQQLSGKAGDTIFARFEKLFSNNIINPQDILNIPQQKLRASGMSNAKVRYVKNLAEAVINKTVDISNLDSMTDEKVIEDLIKVKGIGPWTAEMFLMFTLGRENVFSFGDLGLKKGMMKVYNLKKEPSLEKKEKIIKKWSPYKTYASRVLWASLEVE